MSPVRSAFNLPERLAAKADPRLIGADERHLTAIADCVADQLTELAGRLDELRRSRGVRGRQALDRDLEIHRLSGRQRLLTRFTQDACLGRMVPADGGEPTYIGRVGLTDRSGRQLLIDWRTPAAEPFFAATHAHPLGLASRRRYRWTDRRVTDYWDEVFSTDGLQSHAALDAESAFLASLGESRTTRMRDVLGTLAADQDAIIRAGSSGALVVDGGPGTGKTVVALHRAAYLAYADPRLNGRRGGLLFVGPHEAYLAYVADVLPGLGEEGVRTCTLRDLLPEGADAVDEPDPEAARLKSSARMVEAVEPAVALYEEPPTTTLVVETPWADVRLRPADWVEAFESVDTGAPHNEAHDQVWETVLEILIDNFPDPEVPAETLRAALERNADLRRAVRRAWPLLEPTDLVADLWSVPAYLRRCAPWLSPDEARALKRPEGSPWTVADLPLLDAMRHRLGDPEASDRNRRRRAAEAADRAYMDDVVEDILAADDDPESGLKLLNRDSIRDALVQADALPSAHLDSLAGPFAHVIVDEAQELTDAEWQLLLRRCPSRSFTVVGDRAQARHGFTESWAERLRRVGFDDVTVATLTINYRTPAEVMAAAEPVITAALPDVVVPTSIRSAGVPVRHAAASERDAILRAWLDDHDKGIACVIGDPEFAGTERVMSLSPQNAKGLEFDLVLLFDDDSESGITAAVDRYVAMTRATQELVLLRNHP
ncbi:MAG: RNA polymerase recycling motor ATPase HelR [Micropruina sp.]|uniref:RNA polymerase recycling motor ATPase HelR n=1 Tax=Micropruina sp. TaxID=2737536 RepID=UPI0039E6C41F